METFHGGVFVGSLAGFNWIRHRYIHRDPQAGSGTIVSEPEDSNSTTL
jgi:hypothetical protein